MKFEDRPEKDTPQHISDELREYGGTSPDGQSIWRFVLAQNCRIHCFGQRNHVDRQKVNALGDNSKPTDLEIERVEIGEHWIPRYSFKGWILQRWYPAKCWGSRTDWESQRALDGSRLLASYPQRGDYTMMPCGPWKSIAEAGDLKAAIRCYNVQQRRNPVNWDNYVLSMTAYEQQERQEAADAYAEEMSAQHRIALSSTLRSVSTSAQEFRNIVSRHSAGGTHLGSSEKWG